MLILWYRILPHQVIDLIICMKRYSYQQGCHTIFRIVFPDFFLTFFLTFFPGIFLIFWLYHKACPPIVTLVSLYIYSFKTHMISFLQIIFRYLTKGIYIQQQLKNKDLNFCKMNSKQKKKYTVQHQDNTLSRNICKGSVQYSNTDEGTPNGRTPDRRKRQNIIPSRNVQTPKPL